MVNSRQKGAKEEEEVLKIFSDYTGVLWKRTPGSGNGLVKGDITANGALYTVEIKHIKDSPITDKALTNRSNLLVTWWAKVCKEARAAGREPLLVVKYNYSKRFVFFQYPLPMDSFNYINFRMLPAYCMVLSEWLEVEKPLLIKN